MKRRFIAPLVFAATIALGAAPTRSEEVTVPAFSDQARQGGMLFMGKCASCHGFYAQGSDKGPPLLHRYYHPGHHSDEAFLRAIRDGARQHHWSFGDMPAVEGITDEQVRFVIHYVREMQRANGVF
ncbi:MAG: cytochrome c [Inquilinus sp.]|nr:cytochrome c [Inquilinus sp.]